MSAQRFLKPALSIGAMKLVTLPLSIGLSILLARVLEPTDYGRYAFAISLSIMLALPAGQGIRELILREVARSLVGRVFPLLTGIWRRSLQFLGLYTLAVWLCASLYLSIAGRGLETDAAAPVVFALILFPLVSLMALQAGLMQGLHQATKSQLAPLLFRPSFSLLFVLIAAIVWHEFGLMTAFMLQFAATFASLALSFLFTRRAFPVEARKISPHYETAAWSKAALPFMLLAATNTLNVEIGILILGSFGSYADAAALRVAQSGAQLLTFPLFVNNMLLAPQATQMFKADRAEDLKPLVRQFSRIMLAITLAVGLILILFAKEILTLAFGPEYTAITTLPLQILSVGYVINVAFGPVAMLLSMAGHERVALRGQIVTLVVSCSLALLLVPLWGAAGAAIGISTGTVFGRGLLMLQCIRILHFRPTAF